MTKQLNVIKVFFLAGRYFRENFGLCSLFIIAWLIFYLLFSFLLYSVMPISIVEKGQGFVHFISPQKLQYAFTEVNVPYSISGFLLRVFMMFFMWTLFSYFMYAFSNSLIRGNLKTFGIFFLEHFSIKKFLRFALLFLIFIITGIPLGVAYVSLFPIGKSYYLVLFVVLYLYFIIRVSLTGYFIQDLDVDVFESMSLSWSLTGRFVLQIILFQLLILALSVATVVLYFYLWHLMAVSTVWEDIQNSQWNYLVLVLMVLLYMIIMSSIQFIGYLGLAVFYNTGKNRLGFRNEYMDF